MKKTANEEKTGSWGYLILLVLVFVGVVCGRQLIGILATHFPGSVFPDMENPVPDHMLPEGQAGTSASTAPEPVASPYGTAPKTLENSAMEGLANKHRLEFETEKKLVFDLLQKLKAKRDVLRNDVDALSDSILAQGRNPQVVPRYTESVESLKTLEKALGQARLGIDEIYIQNWLPDRILPGADVEEETAQIKRDIANILRDGKPDELVESGPEQRGRGEGHRNGVTPQHIREAFLKKFDKNGDGTLGEEERPPTIVALEFYRANLGNDPGRPDGEFRSARSGEGNSSNLTRNYNFKGKNSEAHENHR